MQAKYVLISQYNFYVMINTKEYWMEGDFLENLDGVIFNVKGYLHPKYSVIAFVRYVPDPKGDRERNSRRYRKLYSMEEKIRFLRKEYPNYIVKDPVLDEEVCRVPTREISNFYDPKEKAGEIINSKRLDFLKSKAKRVIELISSLSNVPFSCFGISGSILVELHKENSDLDPIVYGSENCYRVYETLSELHMSSKKIRPLNKKEILSLYLSKLKDTAFDRKAFLESMKGRVMEGVFEGTLYSIRFLKEREEIREEYGRILFKNLGEVEIEAKVEDASEAIFTPCRYLLRSVKILGGSSPDVIREVCSFRSRFCDIARESESIRARGKLERVITPNEEYLRVLVGGKRSHYMVKLPFD